MIQIELSSPRQLLLPILPFLQIDLNHEWVYVFVPYL